MSQVTNIEKLGKDNYDSWKLQMEAILIKNDHWSYVNGTEIKPEEEGETLRKWIASDQKARADIILAMQPSELCIIKNCDTSAELWTKLKSTFESKGPARKATLLKQLLFTKMSDSDVMTEHLQTFFNIKDKLAEMEITIADDLLTILLLYSVPNSYENFRIAIESRDTLPSPEALKIKLIEEYNARKGKEKELFKPEIQRAFFTKNHKQQPRAAFKNETFSSKQPRKMPYKCNYCQKLGHKYSECRKRIADSKNATNVALITTAKEERASSSAALYVNNSTAGTLTPWCFDSGATSHMCNDIGLFTDVMEVSDSYVKLAVDKTAKLIAKGTINLIIPDPNDEKTISLKLENVLCVPELKNNLISISKATAKNRSVIFTDNSATVIDSKGNPLIKAKKRDDLYFINPILETAAAVSDIQKWHQKYGHLNEIDLKKLNDYEIVRGIKFNNKDSLLNCKICIQGKQTATPLPKESNFRSTKLLHIIHSDICGPIKSKSIGGSLYFVTFIDDMSRFVEIHFLKTKDEVKEAFLKFKHSAENKTDCKIKILRSDNGLEYCGADFDKFLATNGIQRQRSCAYTPAQNGCAERMNHTIIEMARCLLLQSKLSLRFWAEAVNTAVHIRNRCPTRSLNDNKTPYEIYFGRKPTVAHFQIFGQKAYVLNKKPQKGKFDARSKECIFIGYSDESKAFRFYDPETQHIIKSRDVKFINEFQDYESTDVDYIFFEPPPIPEIKQNDDEQSDEGSKVTDLKPEIDETTNTEDNTSVDPVQLKRGPGRPKKIKTGLPGRPKKEFKPPKYDADEQVQMISEEIENPSVEEALNGPFAEDWQDAMQSEYEALVQSGAWELVTRPKDKKIIGCRWVLRTKYKSNGQVEKRKARLIAKGCAQIPGIHFEETFSPVARLSSIRTVIAHSIEKGLQLYQLDFVMAYVNGDLDEEIYMEQAKGFETTSKDQVYRLKKSLYGLKQSGRQWYKKLDEKLKNLGLNPLNSDKCVYRKIENNSEIIVIVYVDDIIISTNNKMLYDNIKQSLANEFQMKDMGNLHYCLGIEFSQNENTITLSQKKYIEDILKKFNMQDAKEVMTPMENCLKLTKEMCPTTKEEKQEMERIPYRSLIGSLMYLAVCTRPDISFTVSYLSQFNDNPGKQHWLAAKRVLRYLKHTKYDGLIFQQTRKPLIGYVDADWGSDIIDRKSYTGYVFKLAGGAITWESRKQRTVSLSSTEAEYIALSEASKEAVYLRSFLNELSSEFLENPTTIFCDNQGAQKIMKNPVYYSRTKHIDIRYHFIREVFDRGEIDVVYIPSSEMAADVLTKALPSANHQKCCVNINVKPVKFHDKLSH